jgi:hypothetical protein
MKSLCINAPITRLAKPVDDAAEDISTARRYELGGADPDEGRAAPPVSTSS